MSANIDREENQTEMVLVPRNPSAEMLNAAWADALAEDAGAVWKSMIESWLDGEKRKIG
jgi:hypothetical protein